MNHLKNVCGTGRSADGKYCNSTHYLLILNAL